MTAPVDLPDPASASGPAQEPAVRRPGLLRSPVRRWVLLALFVGLALRLLLAAFDNVPSTDETVYLRSGMNFWNGEGFSRDRKPELHFPPLVPVVLGGLAEVLPDPHLATVLVTLVAGTMLVLPLAATAYRLRGPTAGAATAWLAALAPGILVEIPTRGGGSEALYLLIVATGLYAAVRVLDPLTSDASDDASDDIPLVDGTSPLPPSWRRAAWAVLGGAMFGLAYLARPEGLWIGLAVTGVLFLVALGGPFRAVRHPGAALRRLPAATLLALAVALPMAALIYPYTGYLEEHTGARSLSAKTQDASLVAWRAVADGDRERRDSELYKLDAEGLNFAADRYPLTKLVKDDPAGYLGIVGVNLRAIFGGFGNLSSSSGTLLAWRILPLPITLAALWAAWRRRRDRRVVLLAAAGMMPLATALAFFFLPRYVVVTVGVLTVFGGLAWAELLEVRPNWRRGALVASGVLLAWSFVGQSWGDKGLFQPREPVEQREIGEWIRRNTPENETIMTRSQVVAFYANRPTVAMPYDSYDRIIAFADHYGTGILVADEYIVANWRPQLRSLFGQGPWKGITLTKQIDREGRVVRLFDLGSESDKYDDELPTLAHAGDGSPRREGG